MLLDDDDDTGTIIDDGEKKEHMITSIISREFTPKSGFSMESQPSVVTGISSINM